MPPCLESSVGRRLAPLYAFALSAALGGCAPSPPPAQPIPAVDARQLVRSLRERTALDAPAFVVFAWQLNESGTHMKGRGVARIEPPYKARLDLFLGNGETAVRAALVDGDLRLPHDAPSDILPPPDLMWGVLGVFRPDTDAALVGAERADGGTIRLRYRYQDGRELDFQVAGGRVRGLDLRDEGGHVAQHVELGLDGANRYPKEATYRNLSAFRELKLTRESVEHVAPYPPETWNPNGSRP
jgi:hypothetical protein